MQTSKRDIDKIVKFVFGTSLDHKDILSEIKATTHEVYIIKLKGKRYAVRIATKAQPKLYTEAWVLKNQKRLHIPGPALIRWDNTKKIIPYCFMVETCIEGEHISKKDKINMRRTYEKLSQNILIKIHKQRMRGFGPLNAHGLGEYGSWKGFVEARFNKAFPKLKEGKLLSNKVLLQISQAHNENVKEMNIKSSRLLMGDLHPKNFFIKNGKFSGFVDLKAVMAGDPLWEYAMIKFFLGMDIWPTYIRKTKQSLRRYSYYFMLITMNKLWFRFKNGDPTTNIKKRIRTILRQTIKIANPKTMDWRIPPF